MPLYAELLKELESRDLLTDARRCQEELENLADTADPGVFSGMPEYSH